MKFTLECDTLEEFEAHVKGPKYLSVLDETTQRVFRPARKHGYNDAQIRSCMDELTKQTNGLNDGTNLINALEELFIHIKNEEIV